MPIPPVPSEHYYDEVSGIVYFGDEANYVANNSGFINYPPLKDEEEQKEVRKLCMDRMAVLEDFLKLRRHRTLATQSVLYEFEKITIQVYRLLDDGPASGDVRLHMVSFREHINALMADGSLPIASPIREASFGIWLQYIYLNPRQSPAKTKPQILKNVRDLREDFVPELRTPPTCPDEIILQDRFRHLVARVNHYPKERET